MAELRTADGAIFYEVVASGAPAAKPAPTITLLHNFMSTGRSAWGPLVADLSRTHRVILPDLPGHGRSPGYPPGFDHLEMARQLAAVIYGEQAEYGHLVGCSSGGMLAQLMVHHNLVRPATLTLVSTTYSVNPATTHEPTTLNPRDFRASSTWLEATARLHDPYRYDGYFEQELLAGFQRLTPQTAIDLSLASLVDWQLPLCIIHGERDEIFPLAIAQAMAAVLPNAELHVAPEQTHALLFRKPHLVLKLLIEFLQRWPAPSSEEARPNDG